MESLNNFEPFNDLEEWSDNIDLFMDAMAHPPKNVVSSGNWPGLKRKSPKLLKN
jgi:hypothetical protein